MSQVFFVHINRYTYSAESQNAERCSFNLEINEVINLNTNIYELKCVLLHINGRNSGHYKVLMKHNNDYYMYSDAIVEKIEEFQFSDFNENYELFMYVLSK